MALLSTGEKYGTSWHRNSVVVNTRGNPGLTRCERNVPLKKIRKCKLLPRRSPVHLVLLVNDGHDVLYQDDHVY